MEIVEVIGTINRGGFGIIEKVRLKDRTIVARKTFSPVNQDKIDPKTLNTFRKRFIKEVLIQTNLPHNVVIPILHSSLEGDSPWFIMPVADRAFDQEIQLCKDANTIPPNGLSDILNSLEYIHKLGYVHRDLKPQNILLHEGQWKLADFGLISADNEFLSSITSTGAFAGTHLYCAPEQVTRFGNVDQQADIYSFGAILFDIFNDVTTRVPYSKLTARGNIGIIIEKCTETDLNKRFNNVSTLRSALLNILAKSVSTSNESQDTKNWIEKLNDNSKWSVEEFEKFIFYLERNPEEQNIILWDLNEVNIKYLISVDQIIWKRLITLYFDWVSNRNFQFDFCDVIIKVVYEAYLLSSDFEVKSHAVIASSILGANHNRWFVMHYLVSMCDSNIDEFLAQRIAIEIQIGGSNIKDLFHRCVDRINKTNDSYHPIIANALIL